MVLIQNKDIFRNYEILEKFESGLQLKGFEVKALFEGKGSLKGAYVTKRDNELFLVNFYIPPYQEK
ncbi:MAG: SsrA-binding protein, partial [Patescibacteria group bacterium]